MALDPRISLAVQTPDVGSIFSNILTNVGSLDTLRENRELAPFRQQEAIDLQAQRQAQTEGTRLQNLSTRDKRRLESVSRFGSQVLPFLQNNDIQGARNIATQRLNSINQQLSDNPNADVDTTEVRQFLQALDSNPQIALQLAQQASQLGRGQQTSFRQRDLENNIRIAQDPNSTELERNSARRALGDLASVSSTAAERIAGDPNLSEAVATSQAEIAGARAGATEQAKLGKQLAFKPQITRAVKLAEKEATARGETLTELKRAEAAFPGLLDAVGQLKELAPIATSTFGGRVFDTAIRETGFGATKGGTARSKFVAIINNQVLPLLRETFGAAFTEREGETLKATMGDPNTSPTEKLVQLDAFIDQKRRNIEAKQIEVNVGDLSTLSVDELQAELQRLGGQ